MVVFTGRTGTYDCQLGGKNHYVIKKNQEEGNAAFFLTAFSDLAGTLTQDLRNRNPTLYTTKLRGRVEGGPSPLPLPVGRGVYSAG